MSEVTTLVVMSPNWLGDAVMALPAVADLRRHFAGAHLTVAARRSVADLFALVPGVDAVVPLGWRGGVVDGASRRADQRSLRSVGADLAVLLPNSFASAWLAYGSGIPERWGYAADLRRCLLTRAVDRPQRSVHQVEYYQHLVRALGVTTGSPEPTLQIVPSVRVAMETRLVNGGWDTTRPLVALAPGAAYGQAKRWLPEHFAALANAIVRDHGGDCVLVGSAADRTTTDVIRAALSTDANAHVADLTGATTIGELAATMSLSRVCVTNASGALHVAAAAGVSVVALFGPTREHETAPASTLRRTVEVLTNPVSCRPCMLRECPIDHRCMKGLLPTRVLAAVAPGLTRPVDVATTSWTPSQAHTSTGDAP